MLMVIVVCTVILRKFYSPYLFGVSPVSYINIHINIHQFFFLNNRIT